MFFKIDILRNFANFRGKHLGWNLFNKVGVSFKTRLQQRYFPVKFAKFLRTHFFPEYVRWLRLFISDTHILNRILKKATSSCVVNGRNKSDPDMQSSNPEGVFRNVSLNFVRPTKRKSYSFDECLGSLSNQS